MIITKGRGVSSLGVVGAIGVAHRDSPSSAFEKWRGLKSNFSDRRGRRGTDVGKRSSAVTTRPSLSRSRLCVTRMMTSNGDRGYIRSNRTLTQAPHHQGTRTRNKTHLDLTHDREEQVLTEAPLRAEGDEDEGRDQVKQGTLDKHEGDPVTHDPGRVEWTRYPHHVEHDVSRQVGIESTRQGEVGDYWDIRGLGPVVRVRGGDFFAAGDGYGYRKDVR